MPIDLGRLAVETVIVHDVPPRPARGGGQPLVLSEVESPVTQMLKNYFRERVTNTLGTAGFEVQFDSSSSSPVPTLIQDILENQLTDFVTMSQEIARHLYNSQNARNPAGLLCVLRVSHTPQRGLAILKLEREAGVRVQQTTLDGKATYNLEHLRELMLTEKTRVFKVGLFIQMGNTLETIVGTVSDNQRGYHPTTEVADFFLKGFLGCNLTEAPEVATKRVFQVTEAFIAEQVREPDIKARYEIALLSEMNSESHIFSPRGFAQWHLRTQDRQAYIQRLEEAELPLRRLEKDIDLIQSHLRRIQLDFESGIAVLGDPERFEQYVRVRNLDNGLTHVEIEDRLRRIQGKR